MMSPFFPSRLEKAIAEENLPPKVAANFFQLYETYTQSLKDSNLPTDQAEKLFSFYLDRLMENLRSPFVFQLYNERVRAPFDHFQFGIDFIRPLIDEGKSSVLHIENVQKMHEQIQRNENVILCANHQTEVDPQLLISTLKKDFSRIAEEIIFVAGDRVVTDPLAVPLSLGCNLLCIYSKRHIENPPEKNMKNRCIINVP